MPSSRTLALALVLATLAAGDAAWRQVPPDPTGYKLTKDVPLPDAGRQDYLAEDPANNRLYVSHSTEVLVLDMATQALIGKISPTPGVHGIAISDKDGHGFITNGGNATITEFDIKTLAVIQQIPAPKDVDGIIYDPSTDRIFAFCGDANQAIAVDAKTGVPAGTIDLGGSPEFGAADGQGHVFNVLNDKSEILEIDAHSLKILHRYPLAPCESPSGVAMDTAHRRVFVGCHSGVLAVVNADTGAVVATPKIGTGVDAARFDPGAQLAFASNNDSTITEIREISPDQYEVVGSIASEPGARSMAVDTRTHTLFSATSKFGPAPAAAPGAPAGRGGRAPLIPGSFHLLVFARQ